MQTNWIIIVLAAVFGALFLGILIRANYRDEKIFGKQFEGNFNTQDRRPGDAKPGARARSRAQLVNLILYILCAFSSGVVLINRLTPVYITRYPVHFLFLFLAVATFVIGVGHLFGKLKSNSSIVATFVIVGVLCAIKGFFSWGGDWKTQLVLYRNLKDPDITVETQMRDDPFSLTYKSRLVEVQQLAPFMVLAKDIDTTRMEAARWKRVNEYRNELHLNQPK